MMEVPCFHAKPSFLPSLSEETDDRFPGWRLTSRVDVSPSRSLGGPRRGNTSCRPGETLRVLLSWCQRVKQIWNGFRTPHHETGAGSCIREVVLKPVNTPVSALVAGRAHLLMTTKSGLIWFTYEAQSQFFAASTLCPFTRPGLCGEDLHGPWTRKARRRLDNPVTRKHGVHQSWHLTEPKKWTPLFDRSDPFGAFLLDGRSPFPTRSRSCSLEQNPVVLQTLKIRPQEIWVTVTCHQMTSRPKKTKHLIDAIWNKMKQDETTKSTKSLPARIIFIPKPFQPEARLRKRFWFRTSARRWGMEANMAMRLRPK